jgi:uncharacterized membrane protein
VPRYWRASGWSELATLIAAFAALAAKDPMVVLARQRGLVLVTTWPFTAVSAMGLGVAFFSALAVAINVKNRQRSTLFQIVSAAALTSTSLATCLSATGGIARWCWWLWLLLAMQTTAGILVVHARLYARIAAKIAARGTPTGEPFRRAAYSALTVMAGVAIAAAILKQWWIALSLLAAVAGYWYDLRGQLDVAALQMPLKKVGQLALSSLFAMLMIVGLW